MTCSIRCGRAPLSGLVQDCFQAVVLAARDVGMLIDDDPGDALPLMRVLDAGFPRVHPELLFSDGPADGGDQSGGIAAQCFPGSGECQVVGIAGVVGADGIGEGEESAVQGEQHEIGQLRGGRGALRKVRRGQSAA